MQNAQNSFDKMFTTYNSLKIYDKKNSLAQAIWTDNSFDYNTYNNETNLSASNAKELIKYYVGDIYAECSGFKNDSSGWYFQNGTVRLSKETVEITDKKKHTTYIRFETTEGTLS